MLTSESYFSIDGIDLGSSLVRFFALMPAMWKIEAASGDFRFTLRRKILFCVLSVLILSLMIWNHIGLLLDDAFFRDWRSTIVEKPLFIVGNARSGTTWLHRLISTNDRVFTSMRTWEILFAVSITWRCLFHFLFRVDSTCFFGLGFSVLMGIERYFVGDVTVYPIGLMKTEEDDWVGCHILLTHLVMILFPLGGSVLNPIVLCEFSDQVAKQAAAAALAAPALPSRLDTSPPDFTKSLTSDKSTAVYANMTTSEDINRTRPEAAASMREVPVAAAAATSAAPRDGPPILPMRIRQQMITFYKQCVQRHLYFHTRLAPALQIGSASFPSASLLTSHNGETDESKASTKGGGDEKVGVRKLHYISKNPAFTMRLRLIYSHFPDARVACLLRDPVQSIPSLISFLSKAWHCFADPVQKYPRTSDLLAFSEAHYLYPIDVFNPQTTTNNNNSNINSSSCSSSWKSGKGEQKAKCGSVAALSGPVPEDQWVFVPYSQLLRSLQLTVVSAIRRLYSSEGQDEKRKDLFTSQYLSAQFLNILRREQAKTDEFKPMHKHSVELCCGGISVRELQESLSRVYRVHHKAFE